MNLSRVIIVAAALAAHSSAQAVAPDFQQNVLSMIKFEGACMVRSSIPRDFAAGNLLATRYEATGAARLGTTVTTMHSTCDLTKASLDQLRTSLNEESRRVLDTTVDGYVCSEIVMLTRFQRETVMPGGDAVLAYIKNKFYPNSKSPETLEECESEMHRLIGT